MKEENCALRVERLTVNYEKTPVLWDLSFAVPAGCLVGIVGPNGAGKSTLIKSILGIVNPLSGLVTLFGKPLKQVRDRVAYVPQRESVDWDFPITVRELVLMGRFGRLGFFSWPGKKERKLVERYLEQVGMLAYANRQISQLSGGQQQRVFLARALAQEADLYFMDEPFAGIDLASESVVMDILRELRNQGKTVFVVHHDLGRIEEYFDWVLLLNMRLIAVGSVQECFTRETVELAYGKGCNILDEALKLSLSKTHL